MKTSITLVSKKKNPEAKSALQEIKNVWPKAGSKPGHNFEHFLQVTQK